VLINEVVASNSRGIKDPQGHYEDWIELYNAGETALNTAGMYLTNDWATPTKWRIPADRTALTTIQPHGYLLIWADADAGSTGLHAGFRLNADGGQLGLFATDGQTLIDSVEFGPQTPNVSYGRDPAAGNEWRFFGTPTPTGPNTGAYLGIVADLQFSHERGFYSEPIAVEITTKTPEAGIFYTVDGSSPFDPARSFPTGRLYTGPIVITTTTSLRAVAIKPGWMPTKVDTHTYIFLDDVIGQATDPATGAQVVPSGYPTTWPGGSFSGSVTGDYQMDPDVVGQDGRDKFNGLYAKTIKDDLQAAPTFSLVMNRDDWFGSKGIYINELPLGAERAGSLEFIDPATDGVVQVNCVLAMQGGVSGGGTSLDRWKTLKLSMRPRFKPQLDDGTPTGGPSQFDFKLFRDSPVQQINTFVFDGVLNHSWLHGSDQSQRDTALYFQDQYVADLHNAMGGYSPHGFHAHIYLNGLYWGMYYVHERPDHTWAAQTFGGREEEYDALKHSSGGIVNSGTGGNASTNFNAMLNAANAVSADPTNMAKYQALCSLLDVDEFIVYLLANWYTGNQDWPAKNWYATHRNTPDGKWRFHSWDAEHTLEGDNAVGQSPANIHAKLAANAEYRMRFADLIRRHFFHGGPLSTEGATALFKARMSTLDRAIVGESARWGDNRRSLPYTRQDWLNTVNGKLTGMFPNRTNQVLGWLKNANLYPTVDAPEFNVGGQPQHGGHIDAHDALSITGGTVYYTLDGTDPRVPGTPSGSGTTTPTQTVLVAESAAKRVLVPTAAVSDAWRTDPAFNDVAWLSGSGGVGYERSSGYEKLFSINVQSQMYQKNATCYIRIPFTVTADTLPELTSLVLKVRYDDAFVAYLNGIEVQRANFTGTPAWNSVASVSSADSDAVNLQAFDLSSRISSLHAGTNLLAIQALNDSTTSSDFLNSVELSASKQAAGGSTTPVGVSPSAVRYTSALALSKSAPVKARALSGATWSALNEAVFAVGPVAQSLRISELMYHPSDPNCEYVELTNIGSQSINLNLVRFTDGIDYTFPSFDLPAGGYCLVVQDLTAFQAKYGSKLPVVGQYVGSLDNAGERIGLTDAAGTIIQSFEYRDNWFDITDGQGFSLTVKDPQTTEANSFNDQSAWRPSASAGGSPGSDDRGQVPELGSVVINELLANSQGTGPDWIELYNTTAQAIDIGDWFLSDDANDLTKYRIAAGTSIPAGVYLVFYEDKHFGNEADPGCKTSFGLSKDGETVYLHSGSVGLLTGYSEQEKFDASEVGVALGRCQKSTGAYNFVALSAPTPGKANAAPVVGPVVISEIMYHPLDAQDAEYVELLNISSSLVTLYDEARKAPWRFTDDPQNPSIELLFPTDLPVTLAPGASMILAKDASTLLAKYSVPADVKILAWGPGNLANGGQKIQLSKPADPDDRGNRTWIRVDRVVYSDGAHPLDFAEGVDAWPVEAGGKGKSLSRIDPRAYGNDPANWRASIPSPGQ
jgi:hypothetical protein